MGSTNDGITVNNSSLNTYYVLGNSTKAHLLGTYYVLGGSLKASWS